MTEKVSEKKVVGRNVAIALGIIVIILVVGLVGAIANYTSTISGKDNSITTQNSQIASLENQLSANQTIIASLKAEIALLRTENIVITSVYCEWNGSTWWALDWKYDSSGIYMYNSVPPTFVSGNLGVDVIFTYESNGVGFSPMSRFLVTSLTAGFTIAWVAYQINPANPSSIWGYANFTATCPENSTFLQDGLYVDAQPNEIISIYLGVIFPATSYNGSLTLLISQ